MLAIRRRITVAAIAALAAMAITIAFLFVYEIAAIGNTTLPANAPSLLYVLAFFLVILALPTAVALFVVDWLLEGLKRTTAIAYASAGFLVGGAAMGFNVWRDYQRFEALFGPLSASEVVWRVGPIAFHGLVAGLIFWWFARPGREKAKAWSDIFQ